MARAFGKVRQRKDTGAWFVDVRPHGRIQWVMVEGVGRKPLDEELAHTLLAWMRAAIAGGANAKDAVEPYLPRPTSTLGIRTAAWIAHLRRQVEAGQRSPNYLRQVERSARADGHFGPLWEIPVRAIDYGVLEDWGAYLADRDLAPATRRTIAAHLSACLSWLQRRGELEQVPTFPEIHVPPGAPTVISAVAQDEILEAIAPARRGAFIAAVELLLRPGEVRALNVEDYDRRTRTLTIAHAMKGDHHDAPRRETKEADVRIREASDRLHDWVELHVPHLVVSRSAPSDGRPLFVNPATGRRWTHMALWRTWKRAAEFTGRPGVSLYVGTKHSTATALRSAGVPLDVIQKAAGHKSPRSTERYAQLAEATVTDALKRRR